MLQATLWRHLGGTRLPPHADKRSVKSLHNSMLLGLKKSQSMPCTDGHAKLKLEGGLYALVS